MHDINDNPQNFRDNFIFCKHNIDILLTVQLQFKIHLKHKQKYAIHTDLINQNETHQYS